MTGVNKVILIGNLGNDPETRYGANGKAITNISIATSESWKDKETGEKKQNTEWHRVTFFNRLAEITAEYLKKGSKIYIEGKLSTSEYVGKDGLRKSSTQIIANEMQMLDSKNNGVESTPSTSKATAESFDDDIPF